MLSDIVVALDFDSESSLLSCVEKLDPSLCRVKIGKEVFTRQGPAMVARIADMGFDIFLDLKFHDIPNTVAAACRAAADLGVWMINVHAQGGRRMMEAAVNALSTYSKRPQLIAVTVLTSLSANDLLEMGITQAPATYALHLAQMARAAGLDGVVCSAAEASVLRTELGKDFLLVTPGIRFTDNVTADDQHRIMTPEAARQAGVDYLVIGRPITRSADPMQVIRQLLSIQ